VPLLGVQPRLPAPGEAASPVLPPPPSLSHVPAALPARALTAAAAPFELHPSVAFSEEYSDNFRISSTDKVDNFRSTISPGLLVGINGPSTRATVSASLGIAQDSINRLGDFSFFPNLSAAVKQVLGPRLSVSLVDSFTRSDEPALANQFGLRQQRQTFTSNTLGLSVDWLLDLVAAQGYYQLLTFFDSTGTDTISHILGVDASLPLGALMTARAGYEFSRSQTSGATGNETSGTCSGAETFGNGSCASSTTGHLIWGSLARKIGPLTSVGVSTSYWFQSLDNARIGNVSLFTTYELPGRLSLSGSLGYSLLSADSVEDFGTVTTNTSVSYRFAKAVIAVAILQDFNETGLQGQNFGVVLTRSYTGTFDYALTPFIHTTLRASYTEDQFTGVGNSTASPDTKTLSATAGLVWQLRPWLTMGLDYTYTRSSGGVFSTGNATTGNATGNGNATENRVAIRLTSSF
jgi:putative beta-barrel porin BBP2